MKILHRGDRGARVALLQKALERAGDAPGTIDGAFGPATEAALRRFQTRTGLTADGAAGERTQSALEPWYTGFVRHAVRAGESLWRIARRTGASLPALETANPGLDPFNLQPGQTLTAPLPFAVVPEDVPVSGELTAYCVRGLAARYPFLRVESAGQSVLGASLWLLRLGSGPRRVFYNATHHANEWITTLLLLRFAEELCAAYAANAALAGTAAQPLLAAAEIALLPLVDPDGADLVTGALEDASALAQARQLAAAYPAIPFPDGWKANIRGTDLNLQYPALWDTAREIKFAQGYTRPGPRDYVGPAPLSAPESRAVYDFTQSFSPALILAYHTQGEVIYWKYADFEPPGSRALAERFAALSGYTYEETPYASSFAGYKDWFISAYDRPGYTIEAGRGDNPLPLAQLGEIYARNLGILLAAAQG